MKVVELSKLKAMTRLVLKRSDYSKRKYSKRKVVRLLSSIRFRDVKEVELGLNTKLRCVLQVHFS